MKTKIALLGYGKMGKEIESVISERTDCELVLKWNRADLESGRMEDLKAADVVIEFSRPEAAVANLTRCFALGIAVVCGTTGWQDELPAVKKACINSNSALLWSPNFSIGVNLFFKLNASLAEWMSKHPAYRARMEEIHHVHKKDAPSGTGIRLAELLIANHPAYSSWSIENSSDLNALPIEVQRIGEVPGTHSIEWISSQDKIRISHEAFSRRGFAEGAVLAALWLKGKKGVYSMADFMES